MFHPFKVTIVNLYIVTSSSILIWRHDHVLISLKHKYFLYNNIETCLISLCFTIKRQVSCRSHYFLYNENKRLISPDANSFQAAREHSGTGQFW